MKSLSRVIALALALWVLPAAAVATPPMSNPLQVCPVDAPKLDRFTFLRSLSLDLRGNVPTVGELQQLKGHKDVPESTIDAWLSSDEFAVQAVRRHRDLFWNNITNVRAPANPTYLRKSGQLYWRSGGNVAIYVRGDRVPCLNKPATWDADGQIEYTEQADGTKREGYVLVSPYWAPNNKIKVCAHDAQAIKVSPAGKTCGGYGTYHDPHCGCGPNLRWCHYGASNTVLMQSFSNSLDRSVAELIKKDAPYIELFTNKTMWVNGPIVFFYQHQLHQTRIRMEPAPFDVSKLPKLAYTDINKWVEIPLGSQHAGALTHPAFLLRFQTNFARANRFYNTFLCQPFQAPASGIDVSAVTATSQPDLQQRPGCKYCHALLGPVSSYWGRWTESGAGFLNKADFPATRADCETCAKTGQLCSTECRRYYLTKATADPEKPFLGMLNAYVFRQDVHKHYIEQGPRLMALGAVADNRLPRCVAKRTAEWLVGRQLQGKELEWAQELALDFVKNGYRFRSLVRDIVTSDIYRRVR
ncbi:MAG: hypothetical protein KC502_06035 [Myxococcales bacterium]|nr:hypothetical protein [Myxococcales bacterium]